MNLRQNLKIAMAFVKVLVLTTFFSSQLIAAEKSIDLDDLLQKLKQGQYQQSQQNKQRENDFIKQRSAQSALLKKAMMERDEQVGLSDSFETKFEENELKLVGLDDALNKRMGSLKELFGVLQQVSGDISGKFNTSIISAEYPNRGEFFDQLAIKMGSSSNMASIEEIERVWFELAREMTESGKVKIINKKVIRANGNKEMTTVTRIGSFNLVANGVYLEWLGATNTIAELVRQPSSRFMNTITDLENATQGFTPFALDPTGGSILGLLVQVPDTLERVEQGGTVGFVILVIGFFAFLLAGERYISLFIIEKKVKKQLKTKQLSDNNPLGRVLKIKEKYSDVALDTFELKLSEAIIKEMPMLTKRITFVKIISVVAPLLGLLGTVTGMINTFQAITLFGTGDPKLMAGGISQALVTTVLGLVVAIPTVLLFTWLNTRSKGIMHILQEQAAGLIAQRAEQGS